MESMTFDSPKYARRLKTVGIPGPHAEAHTEAMAEAWPLKNALRTSTYVSGIASAA